MRKVELSVRPRTNNLFSVAYDRTVPGTGRLRQLDTSKNLPNGDPTSSKIRDLPEGGSATEGVFRGVQLLTLGARRRSMVSR
jgi:hypothetical protein